MSSTAAAGAVSAAEVHTTLQQLAARMAADGHPVQAIKCYLAMLKQSMLPSDEAAIRLQLGQLLVQHTLNVQDAKQHLQKAEMLAMPLHGQHLLKCEVLTALATAHGLLGELDFQCRCYNKGLELCRDTAASSADRHCLVEWAIFFHMHLAGSLVNRGQTAEATQQVEAAAGLAGSHNLLQQQVLCNLFLLQLAVAQYDRSQATSDLVETLTGLFRQLDAHQQGQQQAPAASMQGDPKQPSLQQQSSPMAAGLTSRTLVYLQLHFSMLQLAMKVQLGQFKDLYPKQTEESATNVPPIVEQMDDLLQQLTEDHQQQGQLAREGAAAATDSAVAQQQAPYQWLPLPAMAACVHMLAAVIDKTAGRRKQGHARINRGLQVLDSHLAVLLQDKAAAQDRPVQSKAQQELRVCLSLRMLLQETRQQLNLLCSDIAAARGDAAASILMFNQFPQLLSGLRPVVHLQAGLYAQDVGAHATAVKHFMALVDEAQKLCMLHLAADGRCLAALGCLAQGSDESANLARELLGPLTNEGDVSLGYGYGSRCLQHTVTGLLQLRQANLTSEGREDANQNFSKALKMAHGRLHNHQVVSQLLMLMAPLQVAAANMSDAKKLLSSCVQLSHGASDLPTQIKALSMMQQLLEVSGVQDEQASNRNYVARKQEELSGKIQDAESNAQQHHMVLTWGVN